MEAKFGVFLGCFILSTGWNVVDAACSADLRTFDVSNMNLTMIDRLDSRDCLAASTVNLSLNFITSLYNDSLDLMWNIRILDLSVNEIEEIPDDMFIPKRWLEHLNISHNLLETLPLDFFNNKQNLVTVDLSHNRISYIPLAVFRFKMVSIQVVDLQYNQLTAFEPWAYFGQAIRLLDLRYNNISTFTNDYNWTIEYRLVYDAVSSRTLCFCIHCSLIIIPETKAKLTFYHT